ncbi:hypothetical protein BLOT_008904, partial [Blomia tropicalis]
KEVAGEVDEVDDEVDNDDVDDEETVDEDDDADVHVTEVGAAPTRTALEGAELLDVEDEAAAIVTEDAAATDGDDVEDTDDTQMDEAAGMHSAVNGTVWSEPDPITLGARFRQNAYALDFAIPILKDERIEFISIDLHETVSYKRSMLPKRNVNQSVSEQKS